MAETVQHAAGDPLYRASAGQAGDDTIRSEGTLIVASGLWAPVLFWTGILSGQVGFPLVYTEYRNSPSLQFVSSAGRTRSLAPGFAASADACVSFDGKRILFAGKQKSGDSWQIWEIAWSDGAPRRITSGAQDAIAPFYVPPDKVVYSRRTPQGYQIEIMPLDGSTAPLRLTYAPGDHIASDVLRDGRVLFEAQHPDAASQIRDLFTVYPDGSGVETHRCDHGRDRHAGRELENGDIVFETGGRLARFTSARAVAIDLRLPPGEFKAPLAEMAQNEWLVAYRSSPAQRFAIYRLHAGDAKLEKTLATPGGDAFAPVIVRPRTPPKWFPSSLGDRNGANTLCLNVYTSKERIPEAAITAVRVWAQKNDGSPVALGEAPVEQDGSFYVNVPSERPIRFELLDRNRKTVVAEKGWFWMRRGEQRVCVGCHAGPERAPDNAAPQVLLRTTEPVKMELPK